MLYDQIKFDMTSALKSAESLRVQTLRMLMSEVNYEKIRLQREITDTDVQTVLAREVKKRREAIESYEAAGRSEAATQERVEMEILQEYMPKLMTEDEIRAQLGALKEIEGIKEFGQVMRVVSPIFRGKAEGAIVAKVVKQWLG